MTIRRKKNRKPFYNCIEYEKKGVSCGHSSNFIQEEVLVEYIKGKLDIFVENNFEDIVIVDKNDVKVSLENDMNEVQRQIDKQILLSNNLLNLYSEGTINAIQFKLLKEVIEKIEVNTSGIININWKVEKN